MDSEYSVVPLGEVAAVRSGYAFKSSDMGDIGYPLIKIGNIEPPRVEIEGCDRIPEEVVRRTPNSERYILKAGDILIAMTGATAGKVGRFPVVDDTCYLNQRVGKVYPSDLEAVSHEYLYQVLARESFSQEILSLADGSAQGNVSGKLIETYEIPLPPLGIQRSIAHVLGKLDEKIELNRKTSETLEGIAKALFKSWFVDFDPVRAKAEGRPTGLRDEISELFPDSFEESELGEIPRGWKATTISNLCEVVTKGTTPTSIGGSFSSSGIPFYKVESISESGQIIPGKCAFISEDVDNMLARSRINEGDILFSIAGTIGRVALVGIKDVPANTNQALAIVRAKKNLVSPDFLYLYLRDKERIELVRSKTVQSVQANFSLGELKNLPLVMPDDLSRSLFEEILAPIQKRIFLCHTDSLNLAVMRDTLLPRLISGELRVPDAEKMLEEVGV